MTYRYDNVGKSLLVSNLDVFPDNYAKNWLPVLI